eukprot:snap_masked-scaffold_30-processed-gene-2.6-mRNA-1 protein AED:1.00 eAED:1.00 QI:0/0/0/0/1/1/2/0/84
MQKDKSRPRWTGSYQMKEHLFEVQDHTGNTKVRHSSIPVPFVPTSFLPSPDTTIVFIFDKGKLEVDSTVDLKKTSENEFQVHIN